jgi:hypothetical protein
MRCPKCKKDTLEARELSPGRKVEEPALNRQVHETLFHDECQCGFKRHRVEKLAVQNKQPLPRPLKPEIDPCNCPAEKS